MDHHSERRCQGGSVITASIDDIQHLLDTLSPEEFKELLGWHGWWGNLSFIQQQFYNHQARYYVKTTGEVVGVVIAAAITAAGVLAWLLGQNVLFSIGLIVLGAIVGILVAWEIQRRK